MKIKKELSKLFQLFNWLKPFIRPMLPSLTIILLIQGTISLMGVGTAIASKNMVDYAVAGNLSYAGIATVVFGGIIIFRMVLGIGISLLSVRVQESSSNFMRQRIFKRLLATDWLPLSTYHSGDLLTRLTSDVNNIISCFVIEIPGIFALIVQLVASFVTLLYFEPKLAIIAFILGPSVVLFSRIWGRKMKDLYIKVQESESAYRSYIQEGLQNFLIIKTFQLEKLNYENLQKLHENRMKWILKRNRVSLTANNIISIGYWAGYFLAFGWGVIGLANKTVTYGTMTAFLQLVQQVQTPFMGLAKTIPQLIAMVGSSERLIELEKIAIEKTGDKVPDLDQVGISFHEVSFAYADSKPILDRVTADILPGELVALVGPSGEGKTTLIRLILALLRPSSGEIYFTDTRGSRYEVSASTRDWLTYVPQGNTLFSGSIADNLKNGKPDATSMEMEEALRAACAWDFILELPEGVNTVIGERGLGLSEGQAQRIAIARAFLKKSPILILDEATSALDIDTEAEILRSIKDLCYHSTCLVITHRLTAIKICSRVFRIADTQVSEN